MAQRVRTRNGRRESPDGVHADEVDHKVGVIVAGAARTNNVIVVLRIYRVSPSSAECIVGLTQSPVVPVPRQVAL